MESGHREFFSEIPPRGGVPEGVYLMESSSFMLDKIFGKGEKLWI